MSSSSDGVDTSNLIGIKVITPGDNPTVDIVFVHGLQGNPFKTWTYKEKGKPDVYWPKDLLPQEIPEARIISYGYSSDLTAFFDKASTNMIHHHAMTLVSRLQLFRARKIGGKNSTERPIIWICHSLGGILVKRALIYSQSCGVGHNEKLRSIATSTQGIVFLATPHMGSSAAAWAGMAHKLIGSIIPGVDKGNTLLKTLETDSETLQNITALFTSISQQFDIIFFYEELKSDVGKKSMMIVEHTSAVLTALPNTQSIGIHADHRGICKFKDENSPGYSDIAGVIREFVDRAEKLTPLRWEAERQRSVLATNEEIDKKWLGSGHVDSYTPRIASPTNMIQANSQAGSSSSGASPAPRMIEAARQSQKELVPHEHDPKMCLPPSLPPFVVPYTQNQSPIKRHHILTHIDQTLKNDDILAHGHSSILVWGAPGSGKTHLIREYVFTRRAMGRFPGGIFWVKAKNREERNLHYRNICQELKLTKDEDEDNDEEEEEITSKPRILAAFGGYESSVEKVVNWLKRKTNWLLVIDGANVDTEDEINHLKELIPTGGTGGQIIFTSLNKNLINYARLGPPAPFEIPKMTKEEGVELLLSEARLTDAMPSERDCASRLVEMMDHLPLAIHLAANYIAEHEVSIFAFHREYKDKPKVSGPGWTGTLGMVLMTLKEKHPEAYNLLNLVSFFSGDIPVEFLKWGMEVLPRQIGVVAKEDDGTRDFHLTVKHLLSFSLVRRTHEKETAVGGREWRVDRLHVQTVIQSFCRQQLGDEQGRVWAKYASDVFCHAFDLAERVRNDGPVFVKDVETFILHGEFLCRIMKHLKMKPRTLREKLKLAHEVKEHQIKSQEEALVEGKDVPLPRRSIFGRADHESPVSNFNSRATTFGSTSSTTTTSDEQNTDSSSMKSRELAAGSTDDGNSSRGETSQAEWTEVKRGKPARTFSSSSTSSAGYSRRGQYTGRRYPPQRASNQVRMDRKRTNYESHHHEGSYSTGTSTPGRGRGIARRTPPPQHRHTTGSNSRMSSRSRRDSPARVNPSSVIGPRDHSPRHHAQREPEYHTPPRANITDRLSPARGPLYSDVARGKSNGHSRHSSRDSSRNRRVKGPEAMSRDSSRSTQSWATVLPTAEMARVASHPASEPPRPSNDWSPPRQHSRGRGRGRGSGSGSGSGSRRGSVESLRGRRASPMDPQRMRYSFQDIRPPPPLPIEPAFGPTEMSRLASAPAATYVGMGEHYYAEQNASVNMPISPPLFPLGELVAGTEGYTPRPTAAYALARGQIPVQVPLHVPTVASGPPGIFIPLAQTTSAPPSHVQLLHKSAPPSGTSSYPVRVHHGLPPRPDYLQPSNDRRGSLPEIFGGAVPSVLSDPGEQPHHWDLAAFQIAVSEPDLGRTRVESSPPPPAITRTLATQTSDFAAMGSQFEGVDTPPEAPAVQNGGGTPSPLAGSPKIRPAPLKPKLARVASSLSNASSGGASAKSPTTASIKKDSESVIEKFSKNMFMAWRSATETKKKIIDPAAGSTENSSTKFDTAVKKSGWIKLGKKD